MTKSYHHGNLRAALIEAAVERAREGGPEAVALREVARTVGVSHNAAYRHFAHRDHLLAEVGQFAMGQLEAAMLTAIDSLPQIDPIERSKQSLNCVGRAYVHFALANPGLFLVAFATLENAESGSGHQMVEQNPDEPVPTGEGPYGILNRVLDEMVATGAMPADRRPGADVTCWAGVHGFATLHLRGPLVIVPDPERDLALERALATIERGLTA